MTSLLVISFLNLFSFLHVLISGSPQLERSTASPVLNVRQLELSTGCEEQKVVQLFEVWEQESEVESGQTIRGSVPEIARQVTVRILGDHGEGSGVIIEKQGQTYTVLTNRHVLEDSETRSYTILTVDGRTHSGRWLSSHHFANLDLALVQFTSRESYRVAEMADSPEIRLGDKIYASGFANWHFEPGVAHETRDWGVRAYRLTEGIVELLPHKALQDGYQIGYTNDIEVGMSGGPLLNEQGQLVGVNGRRKYPLTGTDAFVFENGDRPSETLAQQMVPLSWAIPIAHLTEGVGSLDANLCTDQNPQNCTTDTGVIDEETLDYDFNGFEDLFEIVF